MIGDGAKLAIGKALMARSACDFFIFSVLRWNAQIAMSFSGGLVGKTYSGSNGIQLLDVLTYASCAISMVLYNHSGARHVAKLPAQVASSNMSAVRCGRMSMSGACHDSHDRIG